MRSFVSPTPRPGLAKRFRGSPKTIDFILFRSQTVLRRAGGPGFPGALIS